ncbi:hypothetical protein URH17368_0009 [Alicyclobacillus hesperidum URH17-3-68]|nr:hypothetical protein URH17368_0009 [Alicyclobacillus hesperidum URH17-3-68]
MLELLLLGFFQLVAQLNDEQLFLSYSIAPPKMHETCFISIILLQMYIINTNCGFD